MVKHTVADHGVEFSFAEQRFARPAKCGGLHQAQRQRHAVRDAAGGNADGAVHAVGIMHHKVQRIGSAAAHGNDICLLDAQRIEQRQQKFRIFLDGIGQIRLIGITVSDHIDGNDKIPLRQRLKLVAPCIRILAGPMDQ